MIKESIKRVVSLPENVQVEVDGSKVTLAGNGNENSRAFKVKGISFKKIENGIEVEATPAKKKMDAKLKTVIGHLNNMAKGLSKNFEYNLTVVYSHFPMNVAVKGNLVEINNFTGEKKPRISKILPGVTVEIKGKNVTIKGHKKEDVGQTAGNLEKATRLVGKDRRIYQDGIYIVNKGK